MDDIKNEFEFFLNLFLKDNPQLVDVCQGGKRIRPIIIYETASLINPLWRTDPAISLKIKRYAVIIELIHSTSLIIDDLPSMDNDMYRRDQLTFHAKHGQHSAYLMVYNLLSLIKKLILEDDDETIQYLELEEIINTELNNLVIGQKYDLDPDWIPIFGSRTLKIAELKTASLFKLDTIGPYYLIKSNHNNYITKDMLLLLGYNLGMAFQLSDDFLDLNIDTNTNNYGLETSEKELQSMFKKYHNSILLLLKNKNVSQDSSFYQILDLMNKRFQKNKK